MRPALLLALVACRSPGVRPPPVEPPGLVLATWRVSGPALTTIWGWSRVRGRWVEHRATAPGEWYTRPRQALLVRPLLARFAALEEPPQVLDERQAATIAGMMLRPAWVIRVGR